MILFRSFCRLQGEVGRALRSRGQSRPTMGKGKNKDPLVVPAQRGKRQGERKGERKGQGPGSGPSKRKGQGEGQGQSTLEGQSGPHRGSPFQEVGARREAAGRSRASRTTAVAEDWNPSCLGKGNWRVTYALDEGPPPGRVLKLGDHGEEEALAKEFPLLTAQVVLVVLICLRLKGIKVRDVGVSNLAITDPSSATPPVCFFDLGSWCRAEEAKGPSWTGFWKLCDSYIPCSKDLLVAAVARNKSSLLELKTALLWECQDYHDRLQCQGLL